MSIFRKERRGGDIAEAYTFGAFVAEVKVDPQTGAVKVERMTCSYDVGQAINTQVVEGQIESGAFYGNGLCPIRGYYH